MYLVMYQYHNYFFKNPGLFLDFREVLCISKRLLYFHNRVIVCTGIRETEAWNSGPIGNTMGKGGTFVPCCSLLLVYIFACVRKTVEHKLSCRYKV